MNSVSLGDMSQFFILRSQVHSMQTRLNEKVEELSTGEVANLSRHVNGNFSEISAIEHDIQVGESFSSVLNSARTFINAQSLAFERARADISDLGIALMDAGESTDQNRRAAILREGKSAFGSAVASLNSQVGGRTLFSGIASQTAAFARSDDILASFETAISGATTAPQVMSIAEVWFGVGGAYDTVAYLGSHEPLDGFKVSKEELLKPELTGSSDEIRNLLKLHAIAAALSDGQPSIIDEEKSNLMKLVGEQMVNLDRTLIAKQSEIGSQERRAEQLMAENASERYAMLEYRKRIVGRDVSETVMSLTELQTQLEATFTITSRISQLSLVKFL